MAQRQGGGPPPIGSRRGQDGSRWYNERPTSKAIAKWFTDSVPLDEGMDHSRYVGGITLIEGWEYGQELRDGGQGKFAIKVRNRTFTPYMKVDARTLYFWDWCRERQYVGEIITRATDEGMRPGFFRRTVNNVEYVGCSFQVRVWERYDLQYGIPSHGGSPQIVGGKPVMLPPPASKLVPVLTNEWQDGKPVMVPDLYAEMKAETGALGRALGMAGMLIVPGSGVATAEDIQEMLAREAVGGPLTAEDHAAAPTLPPAAPSPEGLGGDASEPSEPEDPDAPLRSEVAAGLKRLKEADEGAYHEFQRWAREDRGFDSLDAIKGPQLRGVLRKLNTVLGGIVTTEA